MVYVPTIYNWRRGCAPITQEVRAAGQAIPGGMTIGGASIENPEPGGRYEVFMSFSVFATREANLDASWTISRILNGAVMRVPLYNSVQLVSDDALDGPETDGIPWDNDLPWDSGAYWSWNPSVPVAAAASKGAGSMKAELANYGPVLEIGHVIGFYLDGYDFTHVVMDIEYDDEDIATIAVSPPLRRALTTDDRLLFRPVALVTCINAREVMGQFQSGRHMQFNRAQFVEALV